MTLMWRNSIATTWFQGSFSAPLTYQSFAGDRIFNIDDVYKVVQLATTCEYSFTVECNEVDTDDVWLVPYNTTVPSVPYDEMMGTFCISGDNGQFVYYTVNFNLISSSKNLFAFSIIFGIAKIVGTLGCGRQGPPYRYNLAGRGNRSSAVMILAWFSHNILVVTLHALLFEYMPWAYNSHISNCFICTAVSATDA